jgi:serine/threonine protein kinase
MGVKLSEKKMTPSLTDFLQQSLQTDPEQRPSAQALLGHEFLKKADDLKILSRYYLLTAS